MNKKYDGLAIWFVKELLESTTYKYLSIFLFQPIDLKLGVENVVWEDLDFQSMFCNQRDKFCVATEDCCPVVSFFLCLQILSIAFQSYGSKRKVDYGYMSCNQMRKSSYWNMAITIHEFKQRSEARYLFLNADISWTKIWPTFVTEKNSIKCFQRPTFNFASASKLGYKGVRDFGSMVRSGREHLWRARTRAASCWQRSSRCTLWGEVPGKPENIDILTQYLIKNEILDRPNLNNSPSHLYLMKCTWRTCLCPNLCQDRNWVIWIFCG